MVAEQVSDAVFRINVLQPEQRQDLGARLLYVQQHEPLNSKYLDRMDPPPFSGKTKDFEEWSARFIWFMQIKSPRVANALENVQLLRPHQRLHEFALEQVAHCDQIQQAEHMAKLLITAGRELF
eukprot:9406697-Alexandrium_andersonii.AAC.1